MTQLRGGNTKLLGLCRIRENLQDVVEHTATLVVVVQVLLQLELVEEVPRVVPHQVGVEVRVDSHPAELLPGIPMERRAVLQHLPKLDKALSKVVQSCHQVLHISVMIVLRVEGVDFREKRLSQLLYAGHCHILQSKYLLSLMHLCVHIYELVGVGLVQIWVFCLKCLPCLLEACNLGSQKNVQSEIGQERRNLKYIKLKTGRKLHH